MTPVIFDIGNVLLGWDPRRIYRGLLPDDAAIEAFFEEVGLMEWNAERDRDSDWAGGTARLAAEHPERAGLIAAFRPRWHESVTGLIEETMALLARLEAAGHPLYAITNFAADTWDETVARYPALAAPFRDVTVSGREGVIKPEAEIFRRCLDRNGLDARACIFVDDSPRNVEGARAVGLDAVRYEGAGALARSLAERGIAP